MTTKTEATVRNEFILNVLTKDNQARVKLEDGAVDFLASNLLLEFKKAGDFTIKAYRATVTAQALHYLNAMYRAGQTCPATFGIVNDRQLVLYTTPDYLGVICRDDLFDGLAPSDRHTEAEKIIAGMDEDVLIYPYTEPTAIKYVRDIVNKAITSRKKVKRKRVTINNNNIVPAYEFWTATCAKHKSNKRKWKEQLPSAEQVYTEHLAGDLGVLLPNGAGLAIRDSIVPIEANDHTLYWELHEPPVDDDRDEILAMHDKLKEWDRRQRNGEFYTPLDIAAFAAEKLMEVPMKPGIDKVVYWDMAGGTGNLCRTLPNDDTLFISTLDDSDIESMRDSGLFGSGATGEPVLFSTTTLMMMLTLYSLELTCLMIL